MQTALDVGEELQVPIAAQKTEGLVTTNTFLEMELDTF